MTEAQEIIARLETERHRLMLKHAQLGEEATHDLALTEARRRGSGSLIPLVATSRQVSRL